MTMTHENKKMDKEEMRKMAKEFIAKNKWAFDRLAEI